MLAEPDSSLQSCTACGSPLDVAEFEPLTSVTCPVCGEAMLVRRYIGEFELLEVMGRGGMGVVYRAQDTQLNRHVALKLLRRDTGKNGFLSELEAEAAITASINHPHVVKVFTTGSANGRFYIAMELVDKGTLDHLMEIQGRVAEAQALEIAGQIAQGLRAAHHAGLIHRDIKPGNILFSDAHTAKIVDFGLAIMEQASRGSNEVWGTPYYIPPERLDQKSEDFRSDIYSLGATIFHALAGRPPFEAADATLVALKHLKSQAVSLQAFAPWVSGSTAFVINRTLLKDPAERYQSYDELIEHLEYARNEVLEHASTPHAKKRVVLETAEDQRRESYLTTVMIVFVALLLLAGGWYFYQSRGPKAPLSPVAQSVSATAKTAAPFEAARQLLLRGKAALAAEQFHTLAAENKKAEPFTQWCLVQEGLAWLAAGNPDKSREAFAVLRARPFAGTDEATGKLHSFFGTVADLGVEPAPLSPAALEGIDVSSYPALALLLAGFKDGALGDFEGGIELLQRFLSAPATGSAWVTEYRGLAGEVLAEYNACRDILAKAKAAKDVPALQAVILGLRETKRDLKQPAGPLGAKLEAAATEAAAALEEQTRQALAKLEAEKKVLAAARDKAASLARDWRFPEAQAALAAVAVRHPDLRREQRTLLKKIEWLTIFRATLVKDLAAGYSKPLKAKGGAAIQAPIASASDAGVEFGGDPAPPAKKWTELAPESILAVAISFVRLEPKAGDAAKPLDAAERREAAERRWRAGVYALMAGQRNEARKLLPEAARAVPELADQLPLLIPPRRTNVALGKPANSSDPSQNAPSPQGPEKAFDGNNNTSWSLATPGQKWLRVDLGKNETMVRWVAKHASSHQDPKEGNTADFTLQRSTDDKIWTDVEKVRNNTDPITDHRVGSFNVRYVRLLIDKPNIRPTDPTARIYELELYASDGTNEPVADLFAAPPAAAVPDLSSLDYGLAPTDPSGDTVLDERTGLFTLSSVGSDIGNNYDSCRFARRQLSGNGVLVARLEAVENLDSNASRSGIMFRENLTGDGRMVFLGGNAKGLVWQVRQTAKAVANSSSEPSIAAPCWLKLERTGDKITASASADEITWKRIGEATLSLPPNLEAGLAVTARAPGSVARAKMEVISLGAK